MLQPQDNLPSKDEARKETRRRRSIIKSISPELQKFADAAILVGSSAFGKDYCVRRESDIDLLVLVRKEAYNSIPANPLLKDTENVDAVTALFNQEQIGTATLRSVISGVKVEFHLWNKETQYRASRLEIDTISRFTTIKRSTSSIHLDFWGRQRHEERSIRPCEWGYIQNYPVYRIVDGHFVPYEPLVNLLSAPEVLFTRDQQLYANIEITWRKAVSHLIAENKKWIYLSKSSVLYSLPAHEKFPPKVQEEIARMTKKELRVQGAQFYK